MRIKDNLRVLLAGLVVAPALLLGACAGEDAGAPGDAAAENTASGDVAPDPAVSSPGAELPNAPAGFEPTAPDSQLAFGETAQAVTQNYEGVLNYWEVTVDAPRTLTLEEVEANAGGTLEDSADMAEFLCFDQRITYLGASEEAAAGSTGVPLTHPVFGLVGDNGDVGNHVLMQNNGACGLHQSERLPYRDSEINPDKEYRAASLGFVAVEGGLTPTGAEFHYRVESVSELDRNESIYWY